MTLRLDSADIMVNEQDNLVNVGIIKDGETTVYTRVNISTVQNGTAVGKSLFIIHFLTMTSILFFFPAGEDYFPVETEIIFSPSENVTTIAIPLVNDNIQESSEWFLVKLVLPADQVGVLLGSPEVSNITVEDDDRKCTCCID